MLSIKERIEDYYDSLSANKLVFNNKKWNRRVQLPLKIVWILLYFPSLLIQYYKFNSLYMVLYLVCMMILGLCGFFIFINPHAKKQLKKLKIVTEKGFFKHWSTKEYHEYKLKLLVSLLTKNKMLLKKPIDVELADQYSKLFYVEAKNLLTNNRIIIGGSVLLLFIIPLWSSFLNWQFCNTAKTDILSTMKLSISLLLIIFMIIYLIYYFRSLLNDYINRKGNKYKDIAKLMGIISMNLKIKYAKTL